MKKVCVIDDEMAICELFETFLEDSFIVEKFSDSIEAYENIKSRFYDLIITDIKMPHCSGLDILNLLFEKQDKTKVILISGHTEHDEDVQSALRFKNTMFLPKPFPGIENIAEIALNFLSCEFEE